MLGTNRRIPSLRWMIEFGAPEFEDHYDVMYLKFARNRFWRWARLSQAIHGEVVDNFPPTLKFNENLIKFMPVVTSVTFSKKARSVIFGRSTGSCRPCLASTL